MTKERLIDRILAPDNKTSCTLCGRCCPKNCQYLMDNKCSIHPEQHKTNSSLGACELNPNELVVYFGIYCPPVRTKIVELFGLELVESTTDPRFFDKDQLDQMLNTYIAR